MKPAYIKRRPLSDTTLPGLEPDAKEYWNTMVVARTCA